MKVKKLAPEMRRRRGVPPSGANWADRLLFRWKTETQFQRNLVQGAFALLCVWIGVEFTLFMRWGTSGAAAAFVERPPGVEGFLPISALISLKYWIHTGVVNGVHPSGLFILLAILAVSVLLKKGFCSWLCPIGTLSESLWLLGKRLLGRTFTLPRWIDLPLRSLKYLLLFFFVWSVAQMGLQAVTLFVHSPYNKMADVKMYLFFAELTGFAFWTLFVLVILSLVVQNFWCRFLCPYGALLGIAGWLSPLKITRQSATCIDCELCTKACPAKIKVHAVRRVWSDECTSCMLCVEACPVKATLDLRARGSARPVPTWAIGVLAAGLFVALTGAAMLAGKWQNDISREEYLRRFQELNSPLYQHARGEVPAYGPND